MPVLSHIESGVVTVKSASRMINAGPLIGVGKPCFRWVSSFVPPALLEYSPADREVGILIMGTVGTLRSVRATGLLDDSRDNPFVSSTSFANAYSQSSISLHSFYVQWV